MENTLIIGKTTISNNSFLSERPITFMSNLNIEALQDMFASNKDEEAIYDALTDTYRSMLKKAIHEVMTNKRADNCSITLVRKSEVKQKFVNEPVSGIEFNVVSTDEVTLKK